MLKEEKELRKCVRQTNLVDGKHGDAINRMNSRLIRALVRAVREDCARLAEDCMKHNKQYKDVHGFVCEYIAAAIRGRR